MCYINLKHAVCFQFVYIRHKFSFFSKEAAAAHLSTILPTLPLRNSKVKKKILFPQSKPLYLIFVFSKSLNHEILRKMLAKSKKTDMLSPIS